ncbi:MAG: fatty acyl-AMP ligase [Candidatus Tectomicrobia bacterium]|uniref:Fatty acyl-AMP ligase n=1 Tax=Tectimicrobiota bacterium TaxID=2528274 RepID=A0A937W7M1_UNCTE|nr:fatty acyl-AMP ligase [Candidatus Tectomicrobia bacterium]
MSVNQRIVIVDPQSHTPCLPGQVGEIWVAGPSIAQGYWGCAEATAQTFQARLAGDAEHTFLRTGDLGFLRQGELFVTGRLKDVIIIRGCNHYPQDIEATVAQSHPAFQGSGGTAFTVDIAGEERLVIVQEVARTLKLPHPQRPLTPAGQDGGSRTADDLTLIMGNVRQAVAAEHGLQVHAICLLPAGHLPRTSSGKPQRYACRDGFRQNRLDVLATWSALPDTAPQVHTMPRQPVRRVTVPAHEHREAQEERYAA